MSQGLGQMIQIQDRPGEEWGVLVALRCPRPRTTLGNRRLRPGGHLHLGPRGLSFLVMG